MADEIKMSEEELGAVTCAAVAVGAAAGAVAVLAAIGYAAYKGYEALAESDVKITLKVEEGGAASKALPAAGGEA